jgi:hypothetical protein
MNVSIRAAAAIAVQLAPESTIGYAVIKSLVSLSGPLCKSMPNAECPYLGVMRAGLLEKVKSIFCGGNPRTLSTALCECVSAGHAGGRPVPLGGPQPRCLHDL